MPVWANLPIAYTGFLEDGSVIPGLYKPVDRMQDFPSGCFGRGEQPPFLPRWPDDWVPRRHLLVGGGQPAGPNGNPEDQGALARGPDQERDQEQLLYGPREVPQVQWEAVAGMVWNRPDPGGIGGGPLWSAAPGAPWTRQGPLRRGPGCQFAFVCKLQEYGSLSIQRFLDIDWVKIAHSVAKDIFLERGGRAALHTVHSPTLPISYRQARDYVLYRYGRLLEGRGQEAFGSTLADYIFTEIFARVEACGADVHYKVIDNRL